MQLTFKDLKQQKFTLAAEPSDTIAGVKQKIFDHKNKEKEWDPSLQKLIYSGKILADDKTVEDYKVEEKGFIVCMLAKSKQTAAASSSSSATPAKAPSTPAQKSQQSTPAAPAPVAAPAATNAPPATPTPPGAAGGAATSAAGSASFNDPSALALGSARENAIANMVEMGFPRPGVERALQAAFYNPDRAVEYLMSGIPEHIQQERAPAAPPAAQSAAAQPATQAQSQAPTNPAPGAGDGSTTEGVNLFEAAAAAAAARPGGRSAALGAGAGAGGAPLDFLRNNPQFQQLRRVVQEQPGMLEPILQHVGAGNPTLAATISQNPDEFFRLLSEGEGDDEDGGLPIPGAIHVTQEEAEAINRLCDLGFRREDVIAAYIACDKDEELAANYLFENPPEDPME